jgi:glycosyltransferase involved in cell wall biosynthesis
LLVVFWRHAGHSFDGVDFYARRSADNNGGKVMALAEGDPYLAHRRDSSTTAPKVSIGMPVYNGERYLPEAAQCVLTQTFEDFELIIADDCSTDGTAAICRELASRDPRVRYYRNQKNLGCMQNFNRVWELARGRYFKWAAQDDLLKPTYLERCVAVLDRDPAVALCHSRTGVLRDDGDALMVELPGLDGERPSDRFAAVVLPPHWTIEMHGLVRSDVMRRTFRLPPYFGGDKALMAEIALIGRIVRVDDVLFINRDHAGRTMRAITFGGRLQFHDPDGTKRRILPQLALYRDYVRAIKRQVDDAAERRRCYATLARWWLVNWNALRVGIDLTAVLLPDVADWAFRLRNKHLHGRGIGAR